MGRIIEVLCGRVVAPGATLTALTMNTGNTLTVRAAVEGSPIYLLTAWADNQVDGALRIRSPRMHDFVNGIRMQVNAASQLPLLDPWFKQKVYSQDVLTVELSGSAVALDQEAAALLMYYENVQGSEAMLLDPTEVEQRMVNLIGVETTITAGVGGDYGGEQTLVADNDQLKANTLYALLGYTTTIDQATIRIRGSNTSNFGVGGPGLANRPDLTSMWFVYLSERSGLPCIPVFDSANRGAILVDTHNDENAASPVISFLFAELTRS